MSIKNIKYSALDSLTMFKRCFLISIRNIDTLVMGIVTPTIMMLLFVFVFGGALDVGNYSFIDYIVPGLILQCIGQCASITAVSVNGDMTKGTIDRFRSMPIAKSSVLIGHALAATIRNVIATTVVIGVALLIGFRPEASIAEWFIIIGILVLFILAMTWISVIFGLISKSPESASSLAIIGIVLPFVSSGFVPTNSMPYAVRVFAENQPMTPIICTVRALMMNTGTDGNLMIAIIWCVAMLAISYTIAVQVYKKQLAK